MITLLAAVAGAGVLLQVLIAVLIFGVIYYVINIIPIFEGWVKQVALVILGVIFLIWLINLLLPFIT